MTNVIAKYFIGKAVQCSYWAWPVSNATIREAPACVLSMGVILKRPRLYLGSIDERGQLFSAS